MFRIPARLTVGGILLMGAVADSQAQTAAARQAQSARCSAVASRLDRGEETVVSLLRELLGCDEAIVTKTTELWSSVREDVALLSALMSLSASVRDRRIFRSVHIAATDLSLPPITRAAALAVLANFRNTALVGRLEQGSGVDSTLTVRIGLENHPVQQPGLQPLLPDDEAELDRALRLISLKDPDRTIRATARRVLAYPRPPG